ncbi:MAG: Holliday junction branch migration DNA helicase RuvB [Candidatus Omnitrophica bacterium]|nr:Holliday junction branch migration DNA helicase RuvB [Candidatus Omnitrophota bacterium]
MNEDKSIKAFAGFGEKEFDNSLRPRELGEFIGQASLKKKLDICLRAAGHREQPLDHLLFHGPPGLGKTTLAYIMAKEMGVNIRCTSGPALDKVGDLAAILSIFSRGDVFFIDEIHRLKASVEEALYPAMEDFRLDIIIGEGPSAKTMQLPLPKFTLIGATTRSGSLGGALRDRFGIVERIGLYPSEELSLIIERSAGILRVRIEKDACFLIASRSRGTPRIANRLLRRVRDWAQVHGQDIVSAAAADEALAVFGVDKNGLCEMDRKLLTVLIKNYNGGPAGLKTLEAALGEDADTISDVYEPYLIQEGYIERTKAGRMVTMKARKKLGLSKNSDGELF